MLSELPIVAKAVRLRAIVDKVFYEATIKPRTPINVLVVEDAAMFDIIVGPTGRVLSSNPEYGETPVGCYNGAYILDGSHKDINKTLGVMKAKYPAFNARRMVWAKPSEASAWVMHAAWEVVPKEESGKKCPEQEKPVSKWEYKTLLCNAPQSEDLQDELNRLGDDGWELVVANTSGRYIFKRPKQ